MDSFGAKGEPSVLIEVDMLCEQQDGDKMRSSEESSLMYGDDVTLSPPDTFTSDELLGFDDVGVLFIKEFNYEKMDGLFITQMSDTNDGSSDEHSSSSLSSDATAASHTMKHCNAEVSMLAETVSFKDKTLKGSRKNNSCFASSKSDGSCADARRSYSAGDSNSKNAIAARDNRLKKKKYIADLEESQRQLLAENEHLQMQAERNNDFVRSLQNEVSYLRSVLANQSTLSAILKNVLKTPGVKFSTLLNHPPLGTSCHINGVHDYESDGSDLGSCKDHSVTFQTSTVPGLKSGQITSHPAIGRKIWKQKAGEHEMKPRKKRKLIKDSTAYFMRSEEMNASGFLSSKDSGSDYDGGVCLHVSGKNVSLEFCSYCNALAHQDVMIDHSYVSL